MIACGRAGRARCVPPAPTTTLALSMSEQVPDPIAAEPCGACRGSGVVISNLGGEAHELPCPWCEGGGVRLREHDAQARWRASTGSEAP
jgi:hypothetical protein